MKKIISQLENEIKDIFSNESTGHDIYHLKRVLNNALAIQKKEGGDRLVIGVATFLHDIHRIIQKETGKFCSPQESLSEIRKILAKTNIKEEKTKKILHCIKYHEEYDFSESGKSAKDLETLILQDADNLDAMGAIGIGRAFTFGGAHDMPMWITEKEFSRKNFDESKNDISTIHHFYSKLLKLKGNMNTQTGKKMAEERHEYMEKFLKRFYEEWEGKK